MGAEQRHRDVARRLLSENGRRGDPLGTQTVEFWATCVARGEQTKEAECKRLREALRVVLAHWKKAAVGWDRRGFEGIGNAIRGEIRTLEEDHRALLSEKGASDTERKDVCQLCGFDLGTKHSCPHERGKWNIGSLDLSRGVRTGKVVTGDAEHIVQWDDDEHSLTVLVETGYLRIRPIASNAISISIDEEDDD